MEKSWVTYWSATEYRNRPPGATEQQISDAEQALGVRFPVTLRTMFLQQNGGNLRGMHQEWLHRIRPIGGDSLRIDVNDPWWLSPEYWQPEPPLHMLVPLSGDGHSDMCLDYRRCGPTGEPEVWMVHQNGPEYAVAGSFDEYLEHTIDEAATLVVSATDVETVADQLAAALNCEVAHNGNFSRVDSERNLIVQRNRIEGEGLPGDQFRVPEHPVDAVLVKCQLDDGTLDFVPPQKWNESQPAIHGAVEQAQRFVKTCVDAAGLASVDLS